MVMYRELFTLYTVPGTMHNTIRPMIFCYNLPFRRLSSSSARKSSSLYMSIPCRRIGLSRPAWFSVKSAPYVLSKPLHGSQRKLSDDQNGLLIEIEVIPNFELETLILSYGERVKVLAPEHFKDRISARIKEMATNYNIDLTP